MGCTMSSMLNHKVVTYEIYSKQKPLSLDCKSKGTIIKGLGSANSATFLQLPLHPVFFP